VGRKTDLGLNKEGPSGSRAQPLGQAAPCSAAARLVEGGPADTCAISAAHSRAAATTNLARAILALVLRALLGPAKSCALVNFFMIRPR
jgi:hypothetical protein